MAETKRFKVINPPLSIRKEANGDKIAETLKYGAEITVDPDSRTEAGGYVWWKHDKGWSAEKAVWTNNRYMVEISDSASDEPRTFEVAVSSLSIREEAGGARKSEKLYRGDVITTVPGSRTVDGRYIWWQHDRGWSAETTVDGRIIYMKEIFERTQSGDEGTEGTIEAPKAPTPPEHPEGKVVMGVVEGVKARYSASLNPNLGYIRTMRKGETVTADFDTLTFADNYWWVKHDIGWSAWQNVDGSEVYLAVPGSIPGVLIIGENGPREEDLPGLSSMILRLPVDLKNIQWFQYFGNNVFAYQYGKKYNYDGYSQGLHGGLDLGNSIRSGVPIYAGVHAKYDGLDTARAGNFRVRLRTDDDYLLIYQHIINPRAFQPGEEITPDTVIAEIQTTAQGGSDHLHFEIRLLRKWIINPLLLMPDEMVNSITDKFNPAQLRTNNVTDSELFYFYKAADWTKWTTPLEQPIIELAADP
ncbi:MAG: M23 family metallopeptidase, partial [Anaerolineae bacterium]|nr:M23 family metallopeptidase [Anaerolineae bacterium]